MTSKNKLSLKK